MVIPRTLTPRTLLSPRSLFPSLLCTLALSCAGAASPPQAALPVAAQSLSPPPNAAQAAELDRYRRLANDYGQLSRYASDDAALPPPAAPNTRVIFFGDSITDSWHLDQFFPGRNYLNRGISGQTTPQMLVRFRQDVLALHPAVLVVLAGTNDLAGNTGPETLTQVEDNYSTLAELSHLHGIRVVFASVTPVNDSVHPDMSHGRPPASILALNTWLANYCAANGHTYLDYFSAMVDPGGMLRRELSGDGLHPNAAGYAVMAPLAQAAVTRALRGN